ncbi:MAG: HlyC/CorC family transporter [Hyphomicrobiales bacterium]|nr:HlyC/CorC family transporter [Hyphomicrobiales bacterium]
MFLVEVAVILALTVLNGLLALAEMAIVSSRRSRLDVMARSGVAGARTALDLVDDPGRFLATVQIGITVVAIVAGAFGGATIADRLGEALDQVAWIAPNGRTIAIGMVVAVVAYGSLVIGELVPKRIALTDPERVAVAVARPMATLSRLATPAVWLLRYSSDAILRPFGFGGVRETKVSQQEIRSLIAEGTRTGVFAPQERDMIDGVLRLADRSVRVIMTPRSDIVWIDRTARADTLVDKALSGHTRLLVCDGDVDHPIGFVDARDILAGALGEDSLDLRATVPRPLVVNDGVTVLRLIELIRWAGVHIALVADEYGSTEGIVTATDILESIAGELPDRGEPVHPMVVHRSDGSWLVDGMMPIDMFEELVGVTGLESGGGFETVAGFVLFSLGRLPATGDCFERDGLTIEVVDMDGRRIDKLAVSRDEPDRHAGGGA